MGREQIHFTAPPAERLDDEMRRFLSWWNGPSREMDGILRAGVAHLYFVTIHPFADGNGRIARVVTDVALAQDERFPRRLYSLSHRIHSVRSEYYRVLEAAQRGDLEITDWLLWFLETYACSLTAAEGRIHRSRVIDRYYRWMAHVSLNDRQTKVMKKMIDAYPEGFSGGMTNRKYVSITGTSSESAKRDLAGLVRHGLLEKGDAAGRSTHYVLAHLDAEGEPGPS
jgi:Fic family protein